MTSDMGKGEGLYPESVYNYFCGNADRVVPAEF